jgi:hypothetical protein
VNFTESCPEFERRTQCVDDEVSNRVGLVFIPFHLVIRTLVQKILGTSFLNFLQWHLCTFGRYSLLLFFCVLCMTCKAFPFAIDFSFACGPLWFGLLREFHKPSQAFSF